MQLFEAALRQVGRSVNALLQLDSDCLDRLTAMQGALLRVHVRGFDSECDIHIVAAGIELLSPTEDRQPDVTISGSPLALLRLLSSGNSTGPVQGGDIYFAGDVQLARRLAQVAAELDIDWEEWLAQRFGDVAAHHIGNGMRQLSHWVQRARQSLHAAAGEYLQEEAGHLPTRVEIEHFMDEVDTLRDAVARLEARIVALYKP